MIIIAFEGLDKSGKHSTSEMLYKALYEQGYNVEKSEFHNYSTPTGQLIRKFLDGEYKVNQYAIECIMAADKYAQIDWFKELEKETDVLILDRYVLSQMVYGVANGVDIDFTLNLLEHLPVPNYHFFLDVSPEVSMSRKGKHGDNDKYEGDLELLTKAREKYLQVMEIEQADGKAMILDGTSPIDKLHEEILAATLSLLEERKVA